MKMKKILDTYKIFDIVVVPFPFVDSLETKNRPAVVLSTSNSIGQSILAMITSATHTNWTNDVFINDLYACGLQKESIIRFKLFTLDNRLIKSYIGKLSSKDQSILKKAFAATFKNLI